MKATPQGIWTVTTVVVRTQIVGFHCWHQAPPARSYLRSVHRHVFGVSVEFTVSHNDRQIEFHDAEDELVRKANELFQELGLTDSQLGGPHSCESIASHLYNLLHTQGILAGQVVAVTVDEDGECAATVRRMVLPAFQ